MLKRIKELLSKIRIPQLVTWEEVREQLLEIYENMSEEELQRPFTKKERKIIKDFCDECDRRLKKPWWKFWK